MRILLLITIFSFTILTSNNGQHRCSADEKMHAHALKYPEYQEILNHKVELPPMGERRQASGTIPVHVILVHAPGQPEGSGNNFSMARVQSQIDVLNQDFTRTNADAGNTPSEFSAVSTGITFCLATVDPNGNPTDGITRYATNDDFDSNEFSIKQATGWDRNQYMNIWVAPIGPLGYAYLPSTGGLPNAVLDGVVVTSGAFGGPGFATFSPYNLGRTATHEVGHYLGLNHTFVGGCGGDDGFNDTPLQGSDNFGCPNHPSPSCGNSGDMFMNYMDYVDDDCMNAFTAEQSAYMNTILSGVRSSLLFSASTNCQTIAPMTAQLINAQDPSCNDAFDGTITVDATGGQPPYTYTLNGSISQGSPTFDGLPTGSYNVNISDSAGQNIDIPVNLFGPPSLSFNFENTQDVTCFDEANGVIDVMASGGAVGNFSYILNNGSPQSSGVFDNLSPGTYALIAYDANNCSIQSTYTIEEPEELIFSDIDIQDNLCSGETNGSVNISVEGGTGTINVSFDGSSPEEIYVYTDLANGNYPIEIIDENGCTEATEATITSNAPLDLELVNTPVVDCPGQTTEVILNANGVNGISYSADNVNFQSNPDFSEIGVGTTTFYAMDGEGCTDFIEVTISGPDELMISVNQTDVECFGDFSGSFQFSSNANLTYSLNGETNTTGLFENLTSQSYTLQTIDENNCVNNFEYTINQSSTLQVNIENSTNIDCFGESTGSFSLSGSGGNGVYTYSVNGSDFSDDTEYTDLEANEYNVVIEDADGCQAITTINIESPPQLTLELLSAQDQNCSDTSDGIIMVNASGGQGNYLYTIDNQSSTTGEFIGLSSGEYEIVVEDQNGCSTSIMQSLSSPEAIEITINNIENSNCDGDPIGSFSASAIGGSSDYTFSLDGASNGDGEFDELSSGEYILIVTDTQGCTASEEILIEATTDIATTIQDIDMTSCSDSADGSITLNAIGGNGLLSFGLNGTSNTNGVFENLAADDYSVVITDSDGCFNTFNFTIESPEAIVLNAPVVSNPSCSGNEDGVISLSAVGGTGQLMYQIDNETNTTGLFENLEAGNYDYSIIDQNGCSITQTISITDPDELIITVEGITSPDCNEGDNGTIELTTTNANGSINYSLDGQQNNTGVFENLSASSYTIIATDSNGCMASETVVIPETPEIVLSVVETIDNNCVGGIDGSLSVSVMDNSAGYTYILAGEENTTGEFNNLASGEYEIMVESALGCTTSVIATILDGESYTVQLDIEDIDCNGAENGSIVATSETEIMTYSLNGEDSNVDGQFENLAGGEYNLTLISSDGCEQTETFIINEPDSIAISIVDCLEDTPDCNEENLLIEAIGGTGSLSYSLEENATEIDGNQIIMPEDGSYTIIVTDENGCQSSINYVYESIEIDEDDFTLQNERLYPIPTRDNLIIDFILNGEQNITFSILNDLGQLITKQTQIFDRGQNTYSMDVRDYAEGIYILEVRNRGERRYYKFLKFDE